MKKTKTDLIGFILIAVSLIAYSNCSAKDLKIISLMPSYTEIVFALGSGKQLVGVSNYCNYPEAARDKEKVGDYLKPNIEKIYSLKPDIVLAPEWKNSIFLKNLKKLGLNVIQFKDERNMEDIYFTIRKMGKHFGKKKKAEKIIKKMEKSLKKLSAPNIRSQDVYIEIDEKFWTVGNKSFINDVIKRAGGKNIFSDVKRGYFQASWESVLKANPDIIISLKTKKEEFMKRPLAKKIKALKNGKLIMDMNVDMISRPTPRIVKAIKELRKKFYEKEY